MTLRKSALAAALFLLAGAALAQPKPKEQCATRSGQFAELRYCVNSAKAPEGELAFGPEAFVSGESGKVWCEGVTGYGIGEIVTLHFKPGVRLQQFAILNGYGKTPQTFKDNSRVKLLRIQTSDGFATIVTLPDKAEEHIVKLPRPVKPQWVRFSIAEVYPGDRGSDTCISAIQPNLEQLNK
ncbi:MAG TPA: hypothetical protein PL193_01790 [Xanthobacteraceae bacterium]|nr:hypothetical protein [Xanthobacteraceae bacterium]